MNTTRTTPLPTPPTGKLLAHAVALEAAGAAIALALGVPPRLKSIGDQLIRARDHGGTMTRPATAGGEGR